jgi:hypothetical protein
MPATQQSKYHLLATALLVSLMPAWAQQASAPTPAPASAAAPAAAVSQQEIPCFIGDPANGEIND